ncbi:MAG: hypothetical protein QM736_27460 [Vicinamibacterales bacterium]
MGAWFASGFFITENPAQGQPIEAVREIVWGLHELTGSGVLTAAAIGAVVLLYGAVTRRELASHILPLSLLGTAAVPWSAFVDGHPYRIRYMVPLIAAQAVCAGVAAGRWRRGRTLLVATLAIVALWELHPMNEKAAMVAEAQWDRPNAAARRAVTRCLADGYAGGSVMASMGSLGHYMQDLSKAGFSNPRFPSRRERRHLAQCAPLAATVRGWILIEEKAEGGDMLAQIARERPAFLDGYSRRCEGAGVALYERVR